jgi:type II secretory pathway pseudopilin PulG
MSVLFKLKRGYMKKQQAGYVLIEALVYAGLLMFAALLAASLLVHMVTLNKHLQTQVTQTCQAYNALALFRRDLACAPRARTRYSVLTPAEIKYILPDSDGTITWQVDNDRLLRIHTHTRGEKVIYDHAVVLESASGVLFSSRLERDNVLVNTLNLSHNAKNFTTTVFTRSLT